MGSASRGPFLPRSARDFMELLYSAPIWGLNRTCGEGTGALMGDEWLNWALLQLLVALKRTTVSQGQPFIPLASLSREEKRIQLCNSNFIFLLFPILVFLFFPILIPLFFLLSQIMHWQNFLAQCGETHPSLLYSLSIPCLCPAPWLQQRWNSSLCQKISMCPRRGPVRHILAPELWMIF